MLRGLDIPWEDKNKSLFYILGKPGNQAELKADEMKISMYVWDKYKIRAEYGKYLFLLHVCIFSAEIAKICI